MTSAVYTMNNGLPSKNGSGPPGRLRYYSGSTDHVQKLFRADRLRAALTPNQRHLCLVMVGLPGRGKSFISRKLEVFMKWRDGGHSVRVFNVGKYRRNIGDTGDANFFDPSNESAVEQRQQAAAAAMEDMLKFFREGGEVGIFDATNSTRARRQWILDQAKGHGIAVVFIESICDDPEVLQENFLNKVKHSPDFVDMDLETAMADLRDRISNYERVYETVDDDQLAYIKLYNLQSKVMCNRAYGRMTKSLLPFLASIHIAPRPIWLCRSGLPVGDQKDEDHNPSAESKVAPLSCEGELFALALADFTQRRMEAVLQTVESADPTVHEDGHALERCVSRSDGQVCSTATCKVIYAYYRQVPIEQAMRIKIEPHTVYELTPLMGGMWNVAVLKLHAGAAGPVLTEVSSPATPTVPGYYAWSGESLGDAPIQVPGVHC